MILEVLLCRRCGGGRKGELELTYFCVLHHCETCSLLLFGAFDTAAQVHCGPAAVIYLICISSLIQHLIDSRFRHVLEKNCHFAHRPANVSKAAMTKYVI